MSDPRLLEIYSTIFVDFGRLIVNLSDDHITKFNYRYNSACNSLSNEEGGLFYLGTQSCISNIFLSTFYNCSCKKTCTIMYLSGSADFSFSSLNLIKGVHMAVFINLMSISDANLSNTVASNGNSGFQGTGLMKNTLMSNAEGGHAFRCTGKSASTCVFIDCAVVYLVVPFGDSIMDDLFIIRCTQKMLSNDLATGTAYSITFINTIFVGGYEENDKVIVISCQSPASAPVPNVIQRFVLQTCRLKREALTSIYLICLLKSS